MNLKSSSFEHRSKALVVQRGAREHFLVARAFARSSRLEGLVVDYFGGGSSCAASIGRQLPGKAGARASCQRIEDVPEGQVSDLGFFGMGLKMIDSLAGKFGVSYSGYVSTNRAFARSVASRWPQPPGIIFAYSYGALELFESPAYRTTLKILDQIDPGEVEEDLVEQERIRWPVYEKPGKRAPSHYWAKNRREWELADVIVVNSEWTARAIIEKGADPAKIEMLPLAYESTSLSVDSSERSEGRDFLEVLWLGTVCLRKGIPYLLEAARQLLGEPVRFTIAGPIQIDAKQVAASPSNVRWLGPVARSETPKLYANSDVFVIPTVSDGFAITQLEAMAHGVPVIATENCGDVVTDGLNGYRIRARDSVQLAERVSRFINDQSLVSAMRAYCLDTSRKFSLNAYAERLEEIVCKSPKRMGS